MKTQLLCALALGLAATATAAAAQDSETFTVQTSVAGYCATALTTPTPLTLGALTGAEGFVVDSFSGSTSYSSAGYYCNAPATVTLAAGPLMRTPTIAIPDSASFTDRIDYKASLVWDDVTGSVESGATPATIASPEANIGALQITVSDPSVSDTARPISGDYAGSVTVTVSLN